MEKLSLYIKITIGAISGGISFLIDGMGLAFVVLMGLMAIDMISGMLVGFVNKELKSSTCRTGLIRKVYIVLLIGASYLIGIALEEKTGINLNWIGDGLTVAFIFNEFLSITENGGKLGVPIPDWLKNAIEALKNKAEEHNKGQS